MTAEEIWRQFKASSGYADDEYSAWSFGDDPDLLASLVLCGEKTSTSSAFDLYEADEPIPQAGEHSVILDGSGNAVCVIRTTAVYVVPFDEVSASHAFKEGEGDKSLASWRKTHEAFFAEEFENVGLAFDPNMLVVCEEFEVVFVPSPNPPKE